MASAAAHVDPNQWKRERLSFPQKSAGRKARLADLGEMETVERREVSRERGAKHEIEFFNFIT